MAAAQTNGTANLPGPQPNSGQASIQNQETNQTKVENSGQDRRFVRRALEAGIAQVQLGQLAVEKGSSQQVKQFGQKMIDDHSKIKAEMKTFAEQIGVTAPTQPPRNDRKTIAKLSALSGPAFDRAYIKSVVKDHQANLRNFQEEAASGQNASLKSTALSGSKTINDHLQIAQQMAMDQKIDVAAISNGVR
jgi:putative membrane protein